MTGIVLESERLRVAVEPRLGAGISDFSWRSPAGAWVQLMRPAPPGTTWFNDLACYILAPWSNRIANAELSWRGMHHLLLADWPDGTAIHGLVKDRPWKISQRSPVSALLSCRGGGNPAFPRPFTVEVAYEVAASSLQVSVAMTHATGNSRDGAMPAGIGFHPFWRRSLSVGDDDVVVKLGGLKRYPCEALIPTAPAAIDAITQRFAAGTRIDDLALDDIFTGSSDGAVIEWPRDRVQARYRCSTNLGHTVAFTGQPDSFCLEPVSMVNDGFNLESRGWTDTGVQALMPGESMHVSWTVEVNET